MRSGDTRPSDAMVAAAAASSPLREGPGHTSLADADELRFREEVEPDLDPSDDVIGWMERKELPAKLEFALHKAQLAPAGTVVELGAGTCWLSATLARRPEVSRVIAVEFSRRRLERLAPIALAHIDAPASKVERLLADFNDPGLPEGCADLVVTDSAFHHASDPLALARTAHRLLRPGGTVLLFREPTLALLRRTRDHGVEGEHGDFEHEYTPRGYVRCLRMAGFADARKVTASGGFATRRARALLHRPMSWLNGIAFAEYAYLATRP